MAEEDVKRDGKTVKVSIDGISVERTYNSSTKAKAVYLDLMFSSQARQRFVRRRPSSGKRNRFGGS